MTVTGIDPGNTHTAFVTIWDGKIIEHEYMVNDEAIIFLANSASSIYCEMIASYGMPVGKTVFETCLFIGRIMQAIPNVKLITRNVVKNALCHSSKAKDANIRQALIDIYGEVGTKKNPGGTFGISGDKWAALAVATAGAQGAQIYELEQNQLTKI